jgi:NAD(P)-dependent dehydrogenase (short-subunit alcohol dehydrogenase family)
MDQRGCRVVVTGGGGGLGEVVVRAVAGRDAHVVVLDRDSAAARRVAGSTGASFPQAALRDWDALLTLNLRSPMRLLQVFQPALSRSRVGACVSISSSAGRGELPQTRH